MTNTEAITKLTNIMHDDHYAWHPSILEAFRMAVDALKGAEGDLISRQTLKEAFVETSILEWEQLKKCCPVLEVVDEVPSAQPSFPQRHENDCISRAEAIDEVYKASGIGGALKALKRMPSAQPEQRWIPVTERLPEEYGEYICTMENGQVQECGFVPENQRGLVDGWSTCEADGHKFLGYADVLAWMPLPEPYKREGENDG